MALIKLNFDYLNFGPHIQIAKVALLPLVILLTLWFVKDGKTTAQPGSKFSTFTSLSLNKKRSPPSYLFSDKFNRQVNLTSRIGDFISASICQLYSSPTS